MDLLHFRAGGCVDPVRHLQALGVFPGPGRGGVMEKPRLDFKRFLRILPYNLLVWGLLLLYLSPVLSLANTAMKPTEQLGDNNAPLYPARIQRFEYEGETYQIYEVPTDEGIKQWAMINPGLESTEFVDPRHPEVGLIEWQGDWRSLTGVYEPYFEWDNF